MIEKSNVQVVPMQGKCGRYVVTDALTGKVLDDAQGYGYKTAKNAWAAWSYKNPTKSEKNFENKYHKCRMVYDFVEKHKDIACDIDDARVISIKENIPFTEDVVLGILENNGINVEDLPFTLKDFQRYYGVNPSKYRPRKRKKR